MLCHIKKNNSEVWAKVSNWKKKKIAGNWEFFVKERHKKKKNCDETSVFEEQLFLRVWQEKNHK